jgi:hypothetical protein
VAQSEILKIQEEKPADLKQKEDINNQVVDSN